MNRICSLLLFTLMASICAQSCSSGIDKNHTLLKIKRGDFIVTIPCFGELKSVKSTFITLPSSLRGRQTLAWIIPENTMVKKGDSVIQMDGSWYRENIKNKEFEIAKLKLEISKKQKELEKQKTDVDGELKITRMEKEVAEDFQVKDETVFSRNKIIEDQRNIEYLDKKSKYYETKKREFARKSKTELQILSLKVKSHEVELKMYRESLQLLDIKAPHDGLLIYTKNWRGEKPGIGNSYWRGTKLAELPDLSRMEAKIFVLESEAAGLKKGLPVTLTLDSLPGKEFHGTIENIGTIAKPLEEDSLLKYFEITASLEHTDTAVMKPGNQVNGTITVSKTDNVISVPNQSLFFEEEDVYVYVLQKSKIIRQKVKIGTRSLARTIIEEGLKEDVTILLEVPEKGDR